MRAGTLGTERIGRKTDEPLRDVLSPPLVRGDMGVITRRVNTRFGTAFAEFDPTEENVARALREIDDHWRDRRGGGRRLERIVPRPSVTRDGLKGEMRERYRREVPARLRERAERLYEAFAAIADGGAP